MKIEEYLEILFNDSPNPCYFIDVETKKIVYINQIFKKKFQLFDDYLQKSCDEILPHTTGVCLLCQGLAIDSESFYEQVVFSEYLNTNLRSNSTILELCGMKLLMTKFFLTADNEQQIQDNQNFQDAMTECLDLLALPNQKQSIQAFLELLGKFYSAEISYIYKLNDDDKLDRAFYWSASDGEIVIPEPHDQDGMGAFFEWRKDDNELINIESVAKLDVGENNEKMFFDRYNIVNLTVNKLFNADGTMLGVIGMNNRTKPLTDERLLKAVSLFIIERFNEESVSKAIKNLNETDLLTGFFNRNKYAEKLAQLHTNLPKQLGVVFVNLNGLRKTNEYFGFDAGDNKIKTTSTILRSYFDIESDLFRISGDEFVGFIPNIDKDAFETKIFLLQEKLKEDNQETDFSIGHSWEEGSYSVTDLIKVADTVMTINKQVFYSECFNETSEVSNVLLQDLFQAIAEDEFMVYLQPQLDLESEKVVGAEALIRRFDKKNQKMVFPDQFIPVYEKNSIIRHVDLFVIRRVCQLLHTWKIFHKTFPISVNLSRVTLIEYGIVKTISDILEEYNIDPGLIVIEITERIGLIENEVAGNLVEEFKRAGFKLSLDDFGCAYSNIITLAQISVDEVKIDKSLVDNVLTNEKNRVIVKNMLSMCNELNDTSTLAEGIETREQADFLRSANCHLGQGYLYSRPIPDEEFFEKYIKS